MATVVPVVVLSQALPADGRFYLFHRRSLEEITEGWKHLAGSGTFGEVFKGRLPAQYGGSQVAVKLFKKQNGWGELSFDAEKELEIVRRTQI